MFYSDALGVDIPTPKLVQNAFYTQFFHVENIWESHAHGHDATGYGPPNIMSNCHTDIVPKKTKNR